MVALPAAESIPGKVNGGWVLKGRGMVRGLDREPVKAATEIAVRVSIWRPPTCRRSYLA
jgi:hypothetical protein